MASEDANKPPMPTVESAPDPDEDDLDDLDEMLDEFQAAKLDDSKTPQPAPASASASASASAPAPDASGPGRPDPADKPGASDGADEDFAEQLQAGMAEMLRDLETNPEMAKQFEEIMAQFGAPPPSGPPTAAEKSTQSGATATPPSTNPQAPVGPGVSKAQDDAFQETIRRTMDRMRASSSNAAAASSSQVPGEDDMMAKLLQELAASGGGGGDGEDAFSKMLLGMMEQLTNKEILYEAMKDLNDKFPDYLAKNSATLSAEDRERYLLQQDLVKDIVGRFDKPGYSDGNAEDREYILEKMQKMQAAGAPPPDLVGDVNAAEELFGGAGADTGCPQQ